MKKIFVFVLLIAVSAASCTKSGLHPFGDDNPHNSNHHGDDKGGHHSNNGEDNSNHSNGDGDDD